MDDINSKISELLSDPQGMEKIQKMAESLFGDKSEVKPESPVESGISQIPDIDMSSIIKAINLLKNNNQDKRSELLIALKPHLSTERQKRVDTALKLLKIISIIPFLKEQGFLDLI